MCSVQGLFAVAGGSIVGREHVGREGFLTGKNNQDAFSWLESGESIVGIVCDGCSEKERSGIGAELGCRFLVNELTGALGAAGPKANHAKLLRTAQKRVLAHLRAAARTLAPFESDFIATVEEYLLFTVVGVIMTPETTSLFSLGDGVFGVNGSTTRLGPFAGNQPPYMGFHLYPSKPAQFDSIDIEIRQSMPTAEVQSILVGTDGCVELDEKAAVNLADGSAPIGPLSQFMTDGRFVKNSLAITRHLRRVNSEVFRTRSSDTPTGTTVQTKSIGGYLGDDTTLLVIQRKPQPVTTSLPGVWESPPIAPK
jgi:hypothetical protein